MVHLITELSKYTMIILFALYTWQCFFALKKSVDAEEQAWKFKKQVVYMYLFHLNAYAVLFLSTKNLDLVKFYLWQVAFFLAVQICYGIFYKRVSKLVVNNMCMLMCIGFVALTRLSYKHAVKQFVIAAISVAVTMFIPYFISRWKFVRGLTWMYALAGITMLGVVAVLGAVSHGAKLSFSVAGVTVQPSEFIKIIFVFFVASMFYESTEFVQVAKATIVAALHVVILVLSKDLGTGFIFFVAYMVMLYVATRKLYYFAGGMLCGAAASVAAYFLFNHVRVRVVAWQDPLAVFEREGNQVSNSLFAIGTGGWFGMGLNQGMPYKIPEVKQDFIFSAIAEELGGIFAICLILVCVSCLLMFLNIAMQMQDFFYKLVALGLGVIYGFQIFLSIGGDIKFIPSTGVTLPLVSYGGSSLLSTMIIFAVIQGLYLMRERGEAEVPKKPVKKKRRQKTQDSERGGRGPQALEDGGQEFAAQVRGIVQENRMEENGDRELAAQVRGIVQENRMEENGDKELAAQVRGIVQENRMEENGDRELAAQVRGILKEGQQRQRKRPGRVGKEGGVLSHEETIHGTKIQDFDR